MEATREKLCMEVVYWMLENENTYKQAVQNFNKSLRYFKDPKFVPTEKEKAWIIEEHRLSEELNEKLTAIKH